MQSAWSIAPSEYASTNLDPDSVILQIVSDLPNQIFNIRRAEFF
jgi:hypothetical protein